MMKKIIFILLGLQLAIIANSQISQDSALAIMKNHINNYNDCDIYVANNTIGIGDTIQLLGSMIIIPPHDSCWMFFVDEVPLANWGHPCKYVFVNIRSGICDIIDSNSPPYKLSKSAIKTIPRAENSNYDVFRIEKQRTQNIINHKYAVIISGGGSLDDNHVRYWNECAAIYSILVNKYGYDRNKIYVIMSDGTDSGNDIHIDANLSRMHEIYDSSPLDLDGDGLDDIQYAATKANISSVFNTLSNLITNEDDVFIFTTDHGNVVNNQSILTLWYNDVITRDEFALEVNKINNARAINILMEQCFSGGFIPSLCGDNRVVMTACSSNESSYPMPDCVYDEFCYHWFCAMNGETPSGVIVNADTNNDGYVSMKEAYDYAVLSDTRPETPQYCSTGTQGDDFSLDGMMPIHITANTTWSTLTDVNNDIIVDAGKTLTITSTSRFAPKIIFDIQPGAKLVVDGGTLTNLTTGIMWNGIRVIGDKSERQLATKQGTLEVKNGSIIENAINAIVSSDGGDNNTSGGIVQCSNSTFRNNAQSIRMPEYTNHTSGGAETDNVSYALKCAFIVNDNNLFSTNNVTFSEFVKISHVRGVSFKGSSFRDGRTSASSQTKGIYSESSGFSASEHCTLPYSNLAPCTCTGTETRTKFSRLGYGIYATNDGTTYNFTADHAIFDTCYNAVYMSAINNSKITRSNFDINTMSTFANGSATGIYSYNCSGYTIEANDFSTYYTIRPSGFFSSGIRVLGSGTDDNTIYRNNITNLYYGIKSEGSNSGLQLQCNEFSGTFGADINVSGALSGSQGSSSKSAGNKFTSGVKKINSPSTYITYYHSGANNSSNVYCPNNSSATIVRVPNITANDCASTICIPFPAYPPTPKSAPENDDITLYESLQQMYNARLTEYNAAGYDFLLENFDENDADIVAIARLKQDTLISLSRTMAEIAKRNLNAILADSVLDRESLNSWYNRINTQTAKYSLANSYFEIGEYALARQELAAIPQHFALSADELAEYDNFCDYNALRESVYTSGRNYAQLTADEIAELEVIADLNTGVSSAYANSVLCFFYGICREIEESEIDDTPVNNKNAVATIEENETESLAVYVYPNPADEELNILLNSMPEGTTTIEFHDVTGRLVLSEEIKSANTSINISSLRQGVYMYRIVNGDNVIARDRIVKNK